MQECIQVIARASLIPRVISSDRTLMINRRTILAFLMVTITSLPVQGQLNATASITLTARLPSSITVSLHTVPVAVDVAGGVQQTFAIPLSLKWNVDPHEIPGFRIVTYFQNGHAAMVDPVVGAAVSATDMLARWGATPFLPFSPDGTVTLFRLNVEPGLRRGEKNDILELKIVDDAANSLPGGSYRGVLNIEVRAQ